MRILYLIFSIVFIITGCTDKSTPQKPSNDEFDLQQIVDATDFDSLAHFVKQLSGEQAVHFSGVTDTIHSRHKDYPGNDLAADFLEQKLSRYGLIVSNQYFTHSTPTGRNVYAIQTGTEYPNQKYIICAHYDSMPDSSLSPGADDNASGTATVLEAARILSQYSSKYTLMYALWDEEEQGLIGSWTYALQAWQNGENVMGVINIDMIGWDSNDDGRFWINVRDTANSVMMSERMIDLHEIYHIGLSPQVLNPGSGSDNVPFWRFGYSAIGIEEMYGEDWNEYYHTTGDRLSHFNMPYFHRCAQIIILTFASLAEVS